MKRLIYSIAASTMTLLATTVANAQLAPMSYFRPYDKGGLAMFETPKQDTIKFEGLRLRIGGNFNQAFQALKHSNSYSNQTGEVKADYKLYQLGSGFTLANANFNINVQVADGIRVCLENYMSSRHHNEFWVKGGYIQIDKLPFFGSPEWFTNHVTVKMGHMEVNYGDQHFRRSDGGNTFFNPFVENQIMDQFATEIGAEVYLRANGFLAMGGLSGGLIRGDVFDYSANPAGKVQKKNPSLYAKVGYDKALTQDLRVRLTGSIYNNTMTPRSTLFGGDRTGSNYFFIMENTAATESGNAFSGRLNPFAGANQLTAMMINPFIKYKGLELFGTIEHVTGKTIAEKSRRTVNQFSGDVIYRFFKNEQFFIAGRYNKVSGRMAGMTNDISVDRKVASAGWYVTRNMMVKGEYVHQKYYDFPTANILNGGSFKGFMAAAAIAF